MNRIYTFNKKCGYLSYSLCEYKKDVNRSLFFYDQFQNVTKFDQVERLTN